MEAGYSEKVDELCDRYSLEGFLKPRGSETFFFFWALNLKWVDVLF